MSQSRSTLRVLPVPEGCSNAGIGYCDHEYEKAVYVVVEKHDKVTAEENNEETPNSRKRKTGGLLNAPEVLDIFSCGLCGKLYSKLLPLLSHKASHASPERGMRCELCACPTIFTHPHEYRFHARRCHKISLSDLQLQKGSRSKKKALAGNSSPGMTATKRAKKGRHKVKVIQKAPAVTNEADDPASEAAPDCAKDDDNESSHFEGNDDAAVAIVTDFKVQKSCPSPVQGVSTGAEGSAQWDTVQNFGNPVPQHLYKSVQITFDRETGLQEIGSLETAFSVPETLCEAGDTVELGPADPRAVVAVTELPLQNLAGEPAPGLTGLETNNVKDAGDEAISAQQAGPETNGAKQVKEDEPPTEDKEFDFYFFLVTSMIRGSSFIYGKQSFKCIHCDYKTFWRNALIKHMRTQHKDLISQHEFIEMRSTEQNSDQTLMRMSEFVENQVSTKRQEKVILPTKKADALGNFPCPSCSKVFTRWSYLRKHIRTHVPTKNFLCIECGKAFKTNTSLQQHSKIHHKESFTCKVCGFKSEINSVIQSHRQFHNQGSVLCDICGNAYTDKSTLTKHMRVHDPKRPYGCPYPNCTWRFKTEVMCNGHYRAHNTNAQFKCMLCGYAFRHKHHLRRHERQTHGIVNTKPRARPKAKDAEEEQAVSNITMLQPTLADGAITNVVETADGQLYIPIPADNDGNPLPLKYDLTSLGTVNVPYQSLLQGGLTKVDTGTLYIPL